MTRGRVSVDIESTLWLGRKLSQMVHGQELARHEFCLNELTGKTSGWRKSTRSKANVPRMQSRADNVTAAGEGRVVFDVSLLWPGRTLIQVPQPKVTLPPWVRVLR
jgi:hypothetical protein